MSAHHVFMESTCDCCNLTYLDVDEGAHEWKTFDELKEDMLDYGLLRNLPVLAIMHKNGWEVICDGCVEELGMSA